MEYVLSEEDVNTVGAMSNRSPLEIELLRHPCPRQLLAKLDWTGRQRLGAFPGVRE